MSAVWGGHSSPPPQTPPCALEGGAHTLFHHRLSVWGVGGTRERERQLGVQPPHPNCPPAPQSPPPPQHPPGGVPASHEAEAGLPPGGAADAEGQDTPRRWIWGGPCGGGGTSKSWDTHTPPPPPRFFSTGPAEGGGSPPLRRCPSLAGRNAGPLFRGPGPAHPRRGTPPSADGGRPAGTVAGRGPAARFLVRCGAAAAAGLSPPRARRRDEVR